MLEALTDLPEGVIGYEAVGEVLATDYVTVLMPAVDEAIERYGSVRMVFVVGERFTGYSMGGAFQDTRLGIEQHDKWKCCALVSDEEWITRMAKLFGWMFPGDFRTYPLVELEDAKTWVASD